MGVFLIILAVIAGIVALICCILSIKLKVWFDYDDKVFMKVQWAFLKFNILPAGEKKPKKEKPPKETKPEDEQQKPKEEKTKQKKPNPIKTFLQNEGIGGLYNILRETCLALGGFFGKIIRRIKIEELFFELRVAGADAADTALRYGRISAEVFPMLGYICSHMKVGKYDADISPDFLAEKTSGELHAVLSFRPVALTNGAVRLVFALIFKVLLKFLKGIRTPKAVKQAAKETVSDALPTQDVGGADNVFQNEIPEAEESTAAE